jgi:xanthine/CO dehydrogenase XdhC/CoxF family maturation factor
VAEEFELRVASTHSTSSQSQQDSSAHERQTVAPQAIASDLDRILPLWRELEKEGAEYVLASIVAIDGPSYRKPGALMLVAEDGRRAGTVSGGCLEAEVARRAWWLTRNGAVIEQYATGGEDGDRPYGSGCGGTIHLLLERRATAIPLLSALDRAFADRVPCAVATVLVGPHLGHFVCSQPAFGDFKMPMLSKGRSRRDASSLADLAAVALEEKHSFAQKVLLEGRVVRIWANYRPARPGLWIFGCGDDAQPLHRMARELGWYVAMADGRSHLATRERFPVADEVRVLPVNQNREFQSDRESIFAEIRRTDAAVVMTHSFEQDARILAALLDLDPAPAYIGVLGPQRRTRELLQEAAQLLDHLATPSWDAQARVEGWLDRIHAPMGIDLGAESPATIALSILAEIQQSLTSATALPLRKVRADTSAACAL